MNYWLMKSEPETYSIEDLKRENTTIWDGVRNYQARNFLREMKLGDLAFFYHSNCKIPAIVGLMIIVETNINDPTQFDHNSPYFDEKSTEKNPRWQTVKVQFKEILKESISLNLLKNTFTPEELLIVKKGNRLSVIPVPEKTALKILQFN